MNPHDEDKIDAAIAQFGWDETVTADTPREPVTATTHAGRWLVDDLIRQDPRIFRGSLTERVRRIELEAAMEARAAGLREAALDQMTLAKAIHSSGIANCHVECNDEFGGFSGADHDFAALLIRELALLAAPGAAPAEGRALDVVRLAEALNETVGKYGWIRSSDPTADWLLNAEHVAAEYARLAAPAEPATEGDDDAD